MVSRLGIDETSVLTANGLDASSAAGARDVTIANLADTVQQLVRQAPREVRVTPWIQVAPARDFERLRETLRQLASGLCALHAAGKLHRDLKPSNILVSAQGRAVLLDFGLVLDATEQEEAGYLVGTPAYMSPEQLRGDSISPASDWYSVGVLLYEALTGRLPHEGTIAQLVVAKQEQDPTPLQQLRAVAFDATQARLLKIPVGRPGLLIERRAFLADGRAVEFTRSWYRGDAYDFVAELHREGSPA